MEWIISILSSFFSLLLPLWRKRDVVLVVKERYPEEVKEIHVGYEDKSYPKPIKRTVRIPGKVVRTEYLIKESSPRWIRWVKGFWGKRKTNSVNSKR